MSTCVSRPDHQQATSSHTRLLQNSPSDGSLEHWALDEYMMADKPWCVGIISIA